MSSPTVSPNFPSSSNIVWQEKTTTSCTPNTAETEMERHNSLQRSEQNADHHNEEVGFGVSSSAENNAVCQQPLFSDEQHQVTITIVPQQSNKSGGDYSGGSKGGSTSSNNNNNHKCHNFRAPQQFGQKKKKWNKQFKARQQQQQQQQVKHKLLFQQVNKADMENMQNLKNQATANYRKQLQQTLKHPKQNFNKMNSHRTAAQFSLRPKFFLSDARPCKEIIIPPTKFLLGGNISDPLNLNSLQDETISGTTPNQTPKQSPITTPPKVEVIIPPNIHDPLHLLDPVDSVEYEKQLVSPMKRKSKAKHRHRKKKPKRRRIQATSTVQSATAALESTAVGASKPPCDFSNIIFSAASSTKDESFASIMSVESDTNNSFTTELCATVSGESSTIEAFGKGENLNIDRNLKVDSSREEETTNRRKPSTVTSGSPFATISRRSLDREKITKDLRLDLNIASSNNEQQQQLHVASQHQHNININVCGGGRKRRISEGPNHPKSKFRRMDSMDKIVSPVVPQPGAWKRPPRTVSTGARKMSRVHSNSISESDLASPTEESKTSESVSTRANTPDIDSVQQNENLLHSHQRLIQMPNNNQSQTSNKLSATIAEQELPKFKAVNLKYQYGNYDHYAGHRNLNEFMDVRLKVFQQNPHLFRGKDILDIGCNVGHLTIAVAQNLSPKSIMGIDIDKNLIAKAKKNLTRYVRIPKEETKVVKKESDIEHMQANTKPATRSTIDQNDEKNSDVKDNLLKVKSLTQKCAEETKSDHTEKSAVSSVKPLSNNMVEKKKKRRRRRRGKSVKQQNIPQTHGAKYFRNRSKMETERIEYFPISFPICYGPIARIHDSPDHESPSQCTSKEALEFPHNVYFRAANYVLKDEYMLNNESQQYDLILCLSVAKWIHLNFGDAGLKFAFKRMFNQLRPGGKLILEAQNWASYKKKRNLTEKIYNNYRNIEFYPNRFHEYLLSNEVGFSHSYCLGVPRHANKGFCRPVQLYAKGDFTPNHVRWSDNYHPQTPYEPYRGIYANLNSIRPLWSFDTPRELGSQSFRQTPLHYGLSTSQYYNPLETDSYLPSYDTEVPNRHYVFASPLYQTVWSPPANMRGSSSHTPLFGSIREVDGDENDVPRHVYPPNEECSSPLTRSGAFNSVREIDLEEQPQNGHVYAPNCDSSSSPNNNEMSPIANRHVEHDENAQLPEANQNQ